jgi:putative transposase
VLKAELPMCSVLAAPGADGGFGKAQQAGHLQHRTGQQFTGAAFIGALPGHGITISMDGKGAWRDNVFVERLWRSVKYEEVYLHAYDSAPEARFFDRLLLRFLQSPRASASLDGFTSDQAYFHPAATPHGILTLAEAPLIDAENLFKTTGTTSVCLPIPSIRAGGASRDCEH